MRPVKAKAIMINAFAITGRAAILWTSPPLLGFYSPITLFIWLFLRQVENSQYLSPENLDSIHNVEEFGCLQPHKKMLKLQILIQQRVIRDNLAACGSPH